MRLNKKTRKHLKPLIFIAICISVATGFSGGATAVITSCGANSSPHTMTPATQADISFQITNTGASTAHWIKITVPSGNFSDAGDTLANGWDSFRSGNFALLENGSLATGQTINLVVPTQSADTQATSQDWTVELSSDPGGTSPTSCSGSLGLAIEGSAPDTDPPIISDITPTNLSASSVTILWTTDEPSTSKIIYGETTDYGSTKIDNTLTTSHKLTITGLQDNTAYHYLVESTDASNNTAYSGDNTFLTAVQPPTQTESPSVTVKSTNPGDKTPPAISLSTKIPNVVQSIPTISGTATDDVAVMQIEYSTDDGKNWLPVDNLSGLGSKNVKFSFTPSNLDDGNYKIVARAIDAGGNITNTKAAEMVVDLLPPLIGGDLISLGAQILQPNSSNNIELLSGLDADINLSAIGGATSVNISAKSLDNKGPVKSFSLIQSPDTGLWKGVLSFGRPGEYLLSASSQDGAGNTDNKDLGVVSVTNAATVKNSLNKPVASTVSIYYLDKESNSWQLWDGAVYSQPNPQLTDKDGAFNYYLPAGSYYVKAAAKGYQPATSSIVKLDEPAPLTINLVMHKSKNFISNRLSSLSVQKINLSHTKNGGTKNSSKLIGQPAPDFSLKDTNGKTVVSADLLGKPSVLSFMSSWSPTTSEQLPALRDLSANKDINIEPVAIQENASRINAYLSISGYDMYWLTDPSSSTNSSYPVNSLPTHYFIDRNGTIKKVVSGVLSQHQLLSDLEGL